MLRTTKPDELEFDPLTLTGDLVIHQVAWSAADGLGVYRCGDRLDIPRLGYHGTRLEFVEEIHA